MQIHQVDAFTNTVFKGNPAAVCLLHEKVDEAWMQNLAAEMNLSETAFLLRHEDGFGLRWFTPVTEVDLCGHATLASAHVLWQEGWLPCDKQARFHTRSGLLTAEFKGGWIEMDFPAQETQEVSPPQALLDAMETEASFAGFNGVDYLLVLESEKTVAELNPDFIQLAKVPCRGVMVTSASASPDYDFVSRFFAPQVGINEDPVTGSAHCCLAPFWAHRLQKTEMIAFQASSRGGVVKVRVQEDRVLLSGQAVTVFKGALGGPRPVE
jgi:PhzF family phenazine biosynthesis protein